MQNQKIKNIKVTTFASHRSQQLVVVVAVVVVALISSIRLDTCCGYYKTQSSQASFPFV
jgi:hypothetical protein